MSEVAQQIKLDIKPATPTMETLVPSAAKGSSVKALEKMSKLGPRQQLFAMAEAADSDKGNPKSEVKLQGHQDEDKNHNKKSIAAKILPKIFETPERTTELVSSWIMEGIEIYHESILNPAKPANKILHEAMSPNNIPRLPTEPVARWAVDHVGDIWEISAGFTAMRVGFVAFNEALKSNRVTGLQEKFLKSDTTKNLVSKVVGVEKVNKLASGEAMQISDEACFWVSLMTTWTVKAAQSMGWISLLHIHDHVGAPVPGMLFGQGVAAVVLAASHYAGKYHESIEDLAVRGKKKLDQIMDGSSPVVSSKGTASVNLQAR